MKDTIIVSGGNIHKDFALDFLKKNKTEQTCLIAADRGVEFLDRKSTRLNSSHPSSSRMPSSA